MKVKQLSTTNDKFTKYNNIQGEIIKDSSNLCIFFTSENHRQTIREYYSYSTSYIKEVLVENDIITFKTRNSVYTYKITEPYDDMYNVLEINQKTEEFLNMSLSEEEQKELEDKLITLERYMF